MDVNIGQEKGMKEKNPIYYEVLKKDFIYVNSFVGLIVFLAFFAMVLQQLDIVPSVPCWFHDYFHLYCVGCGGTRAIFAMLQGKLIASLYYNPAVLLGALLVLHYEIGVIVTLRKKDGKRYYCTNAVPIIIYGVVVLVFSLVRNYLLVACRYDMLQDFIK